MKYISEIFALNLFDINSWDSEYFMQEIGINPQ